MPWYTSKGRSDAWKMRAWVIWTIIAVPVLVAWAWFYVNIIRNLPDIAEIENFSFKEATTITDKNWVVLYKVFEENRDYIPYEEISPYFVNALIATEDQRFWENPWVDWKGTLRAWIVDITQWKTQWWSTITQQLIKNIMLSPEKKIERKLKEIILALRVSKYIKGNIKGNYKNLSKKDLDIKVKEKILELYSNLIFLWNNSYWVETASMTYFSKKAVDLSILEASILAWLPQAPSTYDPYSNRQLLMWWLQLTDTAGTPAEMNDSLKSEIYAKIEQSIDDANFTFKRDDSAILEFFRGLLSFKITQWGQTYQVTYKTWRKDAVLARMYEEWYITESEFKKNFFNWLDYKFSRGKVEIKAPHFVFWVIKMLEENYDQEILRKEWLTIKTSLDYEVQKMAEQAILDNEEHLTSYEAWNASMLYLDSQNGDIIAYAWSKDFYNEEIDWQVDIIQAKRQPWSSIKPFVYALWFMKLALTTNSPIYDIKFTIANNTPENADWNYNWLTSLKRALASSRNIPAIKMFLAVWWETPLKNFLRDLGVKSLTMDREVYGYPLSIGAWEMSMLELWKAYSHLSAMWKPAQINPILEIRGSDGSILYKKKVQLEPQVIPAWVSYLVWNILADKNNFPEWWVNTLSYPWMTFATKSWTTNVVKWTEKLPRDWWLVNYTPNKVIINWAWNTDGSALRKDAFWWWLNSPVWKSFTKWLVEWWYIQNQQPAEMEVKSVAISKLTWKLASAETPLDFTERALWYINTLPTQVDSNVQSIEVDSLCGRLPTELTPETEIQKAYFIRPESILPDWRDQGNIMERWNTIWTESYSEKLGQQIVLEEITGNCEERNIIQELGQIAMTIMQPIAWQSVTREFTLRHQTKSPFKITSLQLFLGTIELKSFNYNKTGNLIDITTVRIPDEIPVWTYPLKAIVTDEKWYTDSKTVQIKLVDEDINPPYLLQDKVKITENDNWWFDVVLLFWDDESKIAWWTITLWEELIYTIESEIAVFSVNSTEWLIYTVQDTNGNEANGVIGG